MRKFPLLILLLCSLTCGAGAAAPEPVDVTHWRSGLVEINDAWAAHDGDNMAWAAPGFDDRNWQTVDLEDMGSAQPGWHWAGRTLRARSRVSIKPSRFQSCISATRTLPRR